MLNHHVVAEEPMSSIISPRLPVSAEAFGPFVVDEVE